ncbi:MAG: DUF2911 domain-containing protein [Chitinophagaceae bacterium]|nr:DUF2911 domain-containing protein [Chitinophagaceae bacterium]
MKNFFSLLAIAALSAASLTTFAQAGDDKSKRPSPPAEAKETLASGATVTINYSQPSVKGRTIGKDLEPMTGEIWRTGANEATTFTTTKDIKVNGGVLPAGKYALFTISNDKEWTVIFNKKSDQWGAYSYSKDLDAVRIQAKATKSELFSEKLTFTIGKTGAINILWGNYLVEFTAQ